MIYKILRFVLWLCFGYLLGVTMRWLTTRRDE